MNKLYCDICGKDVTSLLVESENYYVTKDLHKWEDKTKLKLTVCEKCSERMHYYFANIDVLQSKINRMTLTNRIRFLFKMKLKEV